MNVGNLASSATASLLGLRANQRPRQGLIIPAANAPVAAQPPVTDSTAGNTSNPLSLEGFQKTWGTNDPTYDLNADGNVDISDISQWIADLMHEVASPGSGAGQIEDGSNTAADPAAPAPTPSPLTRAGFDRTWGSSDSNYDLNADGKVDIQDLTQWVLDPTSTAQHPAGSGLPTGSLDEPTADNGLLDSPSAPVADAETPIETEDESAAQAPLTEEQQAWADQWGHAGSFDFNNDGTVDINDLTQWVLGQANPNTQNKPLEITPDPNPVQPTATPQSTGTHQNDDAPQVLPGRRRPVQFNGGRARIAKDTTTNPLTKPGVVNSFTGTQRAQSVRAANANSNINQLANQVINKLQKQGFQNAPPQNINKLIDNLNLSGADRQSLVRQIAAAYPNGLGINQVG